MRELRETTYQFRAPFVVDSSKFERAVGVFDATPHREAIERTVQWFRSRDDRRPESTSHAAAL